MKNYYSKKTLLFGVLIALFTPTNPIFSQCQDIQLNADFVASDGDILGGNYQINGNFTIPAGVTISIRPHSADGCGTLHVRANSIFIYGTINGDFAGYQGGNGAAGAEAVSSPTGNAASLTSCSNKDRSGHIIIAGATPGAIGNGPGAGQGGNAGTSGSGPKQVCASNDDYYGMIPGSGGSGGGGGASYGGNGTAGNKGGDGSAQHTGVGATISNVHPVVQGIGGTGGSFGATYGTTEEDDISIGSGGAGAGGGGRSYMVGNDGQKGGNGGGCVILDAIEDLVIEGHISVNGQNGSIGGNGGNGGETPRCCSDTCDNCSEATFSSGAGGGAGAGAGSGGGILLRSNTINLSGTLSAKGGIGGNGGAAGTGTSCTYTNFFCGNQTITTSAGILGEKGGDASGGRIKIFTSLCTPQNISGTHDVSGGGNAESGTYHTACEGYLGIDNIHVKYTVYPNPTDGKFKILLSSTEAQLQSVHLMDLKGAIVAEFTPEDNGELNADISLFKSGLYVLVLETNQGTIRSKIQKK